MAQCHAERRKHPSAMDFYVGALHSKLHNSSRDADKYSPWPASYNNATPLRTDYNNAAPLNSGYARSSQSLCEEQGRRSLYSERFSESSVTVNLSSEVKPSGNVRHAAASDTAPHNRIVDAKLLQNSGTSAAKDMKLTSTKASSESFVCAIHSQAKEINADTTLPPSSATTTGASAGVHANEKSVVHLNGRNRSTKKTSCDDQVDNFGRIYKSAELGVSFTKKGSSRTNRIDPGSRLYKSGEQIVLKGTSLTTGNSKECLNGGLVVGSQRLVALSLGDLSLSHGGSVATIREGERWSSGSSSGSADLLFPVGGIPVAKDGRRGSSESSDGGIPFGKEAPQKSSSGGYGTANVSLSGSSNRIVKDEGRTLSTGNVTNSKDALNVRGMGNILAGSVKFPGGKTGCTDSRTGDHPLQKPDDSVPSNTIANGRGLLSDIIGVQGTSNRTLGNLCTGNWSSSNVSGRGTAAKNHGKMGEDIKSGCEPTDPEDLKNAGNEQYRMGNFLEAVAFYDKAIIICPTHASYRSNRAAALTGLGRLGEAVLECEEAIKLDPRYSRAHQRAGHLYLRLGLIESARRHLQAAGWQDCIQDANSLQTMQRHISRCIEARKVGDWGIVLKESNAAVVAGADSAPQVLGYKAEALLKLHRLQEAEGVCTTAQRHEHSLHKLGVAPADAFLCVLRALIEMSFGRFENAVGAAEAAVKVDPRNLEAVGLLKKAQAVDHTRTLGNELFKAGRLFEACAVYGEGLESDRNNAVLLCNRAACRSKLGQWEKAIEDCDSALVAQPHYIKALMRRAHCSIKLERWEDALRDYEVLRVEMPNDMEVERGYFDAQVALKKSEGEETYKMKFGGEVEEVYNEEQFKEVTNLPGLAVVQFVTRWNDRCCQIFPFMDKLHKRFPCVHFVKVDVDENPCIAKTESVTFVPTFKIYKCGQKMKELLGPSEQALESAVKHYSM